MSELVFNDIEYSVQPANAKEALHVLKGVSGTLRAGRLFCILGSSGAGKSTLLDILAQRKTVGECTGSITIDGAPVPARGTWRRVAGYVQQQDVLMATTTVTEALMFSSQLRTRYGALTHAEHVAKVAAMIDEMGLSHRAHARIGNEEARSLSGGEIRRVSIAQELVAECSVLFLDEPTSGLDSTTAMSIMELISRVAREKQRIVCATIHQPSSNMCARFFDDLLLLGKGEVCYHGPWASVVGHFESIGFPCPRYSNPADHIMDLCGDESAFAAMTSHAHDSATPARTPSQMGDVDTGLGGGRFLTPFSFQLRLLYARAFKQWWRDPLLLVSELIQYVFTALLLGALFHGLPDALEPGSFDRYSALFFSLTVLIFVPSFTIVTRSREDRPLDRREISSGMYRTSGSFLARMGTTWPFEIFLAMLFSLCSYWLVGFAPGADRFLTYFVINALTLLIAETIGLMCALVTPNPTVGVLLVTVVLIVCLAFGGFLVSQPRDWYLWFEYVNFFVYALTAVVVNEFDGLTLTAPDGSQVDALQFLKDADRVRNDLSPWENIGVLALMLVLLRAACFAIVARNANKSSFVMRRGGAASVKQPSAALSKSADSSDNATV